jgi:hypothetical protein
MKPLGDKTGISRLESWPVGGPHQVPDAGRGSASKDTLGGETQRISSLERMEIFDHTQELSLTTAANCRLVSSVYDLPLIVDEDEDRWNISRPLSNGSKTSSSSTETSMTSMSICDDLSSTSTSPLPNLAIRD